MKKLKDIRNVLGLILCISLIIRIVGSSNDLFVMPKWSIYVIMGIIFTGIIISVYIFFKEKKK